MKVVILAGGLGSRLGEYTNKIPKPLIKIDEKPIIHHIIDYYSSYGYKEFIIALGYLGNKIKKYFIDLNNFERDLEINYSKNEINFLSPKKNNWKIKLIDTGINSLTGLRLKKLEKYLKNEDFLLTYGDGLSDIDLNKLIQFHKKNKKTITLSAVKPTTRFGELQIKKI